MHLFVSGMANVETSVQVEQFPIEYEPSRLSFFGNHSNLGGVGLNVATALNKLGACVVFNSFVGTDFQGDAVKAAISRLGIDTGFIHQTMKETCESVILYDASGARSMFTDLKDMQDQITPEDQVKEVIKQANLAILCNANFNRSLLPFARDLGTTVATDVHNIQDIEDEYNQDFMSHADILFFSHESLGGHENEFIMELSRRFSPQIVVCGVGSQGALLWQKETDSIELIPAVTPRPVVNTVGAGDSLFSAFCYFYSNGRPPKEALRRAVYFAGWKIGAVSASEGFISAEELDKAFSG